MRDIKYIFLVEDKVRRQFNLIIENEWPPFISPQSAAARQLLTKLISMPW